jgi:hypothetical protein
MQEIPALPKSETASSQVVDPSPICHNAYSVSTATPGSLAASPCFEFGGVSFTGADRSVLYCLGGAASRTMAP